MSQRTDTNKKLVRAVLLGLAASVVSMPFMSSASAQTLREYKEQLAEQYPAYRAVLEKEAQLAREAEENANANTVVAPSNVQALKSNKFSGYSKMRSADENVVVRTGDAPVHIFWEGDTAYGELKSEGTGRLNVTAKAGDKMQSAVITAAADSNGTGGRVNIGVGDAGLDWNHPASIKSNPEKVADMTGVQFKADNGDIVFTNGTVIAQAQNLFGSNNGKIYIGDTETGGGFNANTVLKLDGNTNFGTNPAFDSLTQDKNYIVLTERGTLVAKSAQIFENGLGTKDSVKDPGQVRTDTNDAVDFRAGTLLLDDKEYNDDYLKTANTYIKKADGGTTNVVIDNDNAYRDVSLVDEDSYFAGIKVNKNTLSLGNIGNDSTVHKLNGTFIDLSTIPPSSTDPQNRIGILDGHELHLGSAVEGRELLTVNNGTEPNALIRVRASSTLTLGITEVGNRITGSVELLEKGAKLNIARGWLNIDNISAYEDAQINVGSGTVLTTGNGSTNGTKHSISLNDNAKIQVNGLLTDSNISGGTNSVINIGDDWHNGRMFIGSDYDMSDFEGSIFMDPVWKGNDRIDNASQFALEDTDNIDFRLTVGRNSLASLGTENTLEAMNAFRESRLKWGENGITAALYLAKPVDISKDTGSGQGGIRVDGMATYIPTDRSIENTAEFGSHSLLMVNAEGEGINVGKAALTGDKLTVADDAFLYLDNAVNGKTYRIADFGDTTFARGWFTNSKNIITNKLFAARFGTAFNAGELRIDRLRLAEALPGAVMRNVVDRMTFSAQDRRDNPAVRYVYEATHGLHSDAEATTLLNVAAQPAELAGATATALANSTDFADQAQSHFSFMTDSEEFENQAWVKYGHRKGSMNELGLGGMDTDYDTSYNSVTVGYDIEATDDFRHGVAVSYGKGSNNAAWENDDFNTKGVSWYGSFRNGNSNTLMDVGYYHTSHDVRGFFNAEPDTDVFTMGVTNEFKFPMDKEGKTAVVPHVGLRYSRINTPSYSGYYGGNELFRYDPAEKDIFSLPFGVGFVSENKNDSWTTRLYADVAYVPVIGGRSADMHVRAVGIDAEDVFGYDVSNGSSFVGSIGVKQESDSFEWGLSYRYSGNSDWHNNDVMANVAWKF